jgi:hypothetical protein
MSLKLSSGSYGFFRDGKGGSFIELSLPPSYQLFFSLKVP